MEDSNHVLLDQLESRILQLKAKTILLEGKHRWLRPEEICEVLRNPAGITISEEPTIMPPSGSIFLFDKKVQRHFRKDGYRWKKAKDGKIVKEAHERLKVGGVDTLHCYYAHGEEDENFQRRCYWMLEVNLSHMVLVHYLEVKGDKIKARYIKETETAEGVQHSRETDEITPNSEMDSFACSWFYPSNFQHSQATDATNLNGAQTSESKNTESAYNHQASSVPELQHAVAKINAGFLDTSYPLLPTNGKEREVEEAVSSCFIPTNFQMLLQAIDTASLSSVYTSDFEDAQSAYSVADDFDWESFYNNNVTTGFSEIGLSFEMDNFVSPRFADTKRCSANSSNFGDDETACSYWRASSSVAVEPSHAYLGKRQRDSTASEEGKSKATPHATIEVVDKEEERNDINQIWKRPKVTRGQKSNSVAPSSDSEVATPVQQGLIVPLAVGTAPPQVQEFNSTIQQGELIAGNNPAASDVAVTIDRAITDGTTNDATALSQAQQDDSTRLSAFRIADPTGSATSAKGPIHLDPYTIANVVDQNVTQIPSLTTVIVSNQGRNNQQADQSQPPVPQPTATIGIAISAATNKTAAPESSNPALVQSRPTSNANQDFVQDVESQEKETESTSFEPENGKGKIVVQRDIGTEKFQIQNYPSIIQAQEDDATTRLAAFSITDPSSAASLAIGSIHLNPNTIANVVDQAQDSLPPVLQPTATTGVVISATTNETAASESSNPALVQLEPTSNANQDSAQDIVESQEKETEPTSIEPENGKSKIVVQRDFGRGKSSEFAEVMVMSSLKRLHELLDRASAPNTLASSSISTPTIDSQAIATTRATLEMDFITMAGEVQRTRMISGIQSLVDSNCFPTGTGPMIMAMLKQLEQCVPAYSKAYSEYDMGKNLTDQVEATKQLLQPKIQFCDKKEREFQELAKWKMRIEARQAAILAEIHGAVKESEPIQAQLEKFLLQRDQFKENEGNLKTALDIGDGLWTTFKNIIHHHLLT